MAEIWFGDLQKEITTSESGSSKFENALLNFYAKLERKSPDVFKDYKPIIFNNGAIEFNDDFFGDWREDEIKQPFVFQGGEWGISKISWGWGYELSNDQVAKFTNDLMKLLGSDSEIRFYFQVIVDEGYENYLVRIKPNYETDIPNIDAHATFYEEENNDEIPTAVEESEDGIQEETDEEIVLKKSEEISDEDESIDYQRILCFDKEWAIEEKFELDDKVYKSTIIIKSDGTVINKTYNDRVEHWTHIGDNKFSYERENLRYIIKFDSLENVQGEFQGAGKLSIPYYVEQNCSIKGSCNS